jgi:hypothetical protein
VRRTTSGKVFKTKEDIDFCRECNQQESAAGKEIYKFALVHQKEK